jgi:transcription initiation factor TFIID subunit 2
MDFGTMTSKLSKGDYRIMGDFEKDMHLVFGNCRQFNPAGTFPVVCADALEQVFKREWMKALEPKLTWTEKRGLLGVMTNVMKDPSYVLACPLFLHPSLIGAQCRSFPGAC